MSRATRRVGIAAVLALALSGLTVGTAAADPPGTVIASPAGALVTDGSASAGRINWVQSADSSSPTGQLFTRPVLGNGTVSLGTTKALGTVNNNVYLSNASDGRRVAWVDGSNTLRVWDGVNVASLGAAGGIRAMTGHRIFFSDGKVRDLATGATTTLTDQVVAAWGNTYLRSRNGALEAVDFTTRSARVVAPADPGAPAGASTFWNAEFSGDYVAWSRNVNANNGAYYTRAFGWTNIRTGQTGTAPDTGQAWTGLFGTLAARSFALGGTDTFSFTGGASTAITDDTWSFLTVTSQGVAFGTRPRMTTTGWEARFAPLPNQRLRPRHEGNPIASASFDASTAGATWTGEWVFTEPLTTCAVDIKNSANTVIRSLPCAAAHMGFGEAVASWDGRAASGAPAPVGTYTYAVRAGDGDGAAVGVDGVSGSISGSVSVTKAVPSGPCAGATAAGRQLNLDVTCDGVADLFAVRTSGDLEFYPGTVAGPFGAVQKVASGWGDSIAIVSPGAQRRGEFPVLWRRTPDARLLAYQTSSTTSGQVSLRYLGTVGARWSAITAMSAAGDVDGDGYGDVYGRTTAGDLWLYFGAANGGIKSQLQVGVRWNQIDAIFGGFDVTGDGMNDVIARHAPTGNMLRYPSNAKGQLTGSGQVVGVRWNGLNPLTSTSAPVSKNRMVGRIADGRVYSYTFSSTGTIQPGTVIGSGWESVRLLW
jgi:hypothetical protein